MFTRRQAISLGALAPFYTGSHARASESIQGLATHIASEDAICAVAVSTLQTGVPELSFWASGCALPTTPHPILQAASLSKPVIGYVALKLVGQQLLELDAPVSKFLPLGHAHRQNLFSLNAAPLIDQVSVDILRRVTPRQLLTHSAGFPNCASSGPLSLEFSPGSRWQYSGEGYVMLQAILEAITGKPLDQLADDEVFGPLKMQDSSFKLNDRIEKHLIKGAPRQLRFPYAFASNSLYTTSHDYALFLASVVNDETFLASTLTTPIRLPSSWMDLLRSTQLSWGLGWGIEVREKPVSIWHWGSNPGFRSLTLVDLQSKNGVVVLTSSQNGMPAAKSIVDAAIPGNHPALDLDLVQ